MMTEASFRQSLDAPLDGWPMIREEQWHPQSARPAFRFGVSPGIQETVSIRPYPVSRPIICQEFYPQTRLALASE